MNRNFVTTDTIKERIFNNHGDTIRVLSKFVGWKVRMKFQCKVCEAKWETVPLAVSQATKPTGCPVCAKKRQAENISKGHANSKVKQNKFEVKIHKCEKKFNLTFIGKNIPKNRQDLVKFRCNDCDRTFKRSASRVLTSKHGCVLCAEEIRMEKSTSKECSERNRLKAIYSTPKAKEVILKHTLGRTTLISPWKGANRPRTFQCNECNHVWKVRVNTDGVKTHTSCPECTVWEGGYSSIALHWLEREADERCINIRHARNGGEFVIPGTKYKVDGYHKESNTVFEFHGDAFHGNPKIYHPEAQPHPWKTHTAKHLYKMTVRKENKIRQLGYNLVVMWESQYKKLLRKDVNYLIKNGIGGL
jgi:hypothetical protein